MLEGSKSEIHTNYELKFNLVYFRKPDFPIVPSQLSCVDRGFSASSSLLTDQQSPSQSFVRANRALLTIFTYEFILLIRPIEIIEKSTRGHSLHSRHHESHSFPAPNPTSNHTFQVPSRIPPKSQIVSYPKFLSQEVPIPFVFPSPTTSSSATADTYCSCPSQSQALAVVVALAALALVTGIRGAARCINKTLTIHIALAREALVTWARGGGVWEAVAVRIALASGALGTRVRHAFAGSIALARIALGTDVITVGKGVCNTTTCPSGDSVCCYHILCLGQRYCHYNICSMEVPLTVVGDVVGEYPGLGDVTLVNVKDEHLRLLPDHDLRLLTRVVRE
jgi:hypothetical protein